MFPEQLRKILNLVKKTNDRVVIFDANVPDDSYVVMNFDSYAGLVNNPTAIVNPPVASSAAIESKIPANSPIIENLTEEDLTDKINREISMWKNRENSAYLGEENKPKQAWQIPPQVKHKAQEVE